MATVLTLDPLLQGLGPIAKALGWFPGMNHVCRSWASTSGNVTKIVPMTDNVFDPKGIARDAGRLDTELRRAPATWPDDVVVFGYSRGAQVACRWLREYGPNRQGLVQRVSFVLIGNPERGPRFGGSTGRYLDGSPLQYLPTDTRFSVRDVARSGDAYADPADTLRCRPWWTPGGSIHCNYRDVDLDAPPRTFTRVGNVTFDVVP